MGRLAVVGVASSCAAAHAWQRRLKWATPPTPPFVRGEGLWAGLRWLARLRLPRSTRAAGATEVGDPPQPPLRNSDFLGLINLTSSEAKIEFKPIEPRNPRVDVLCFRSLAGRSS